jgi:hypothetical protein
VRKDTHFQGTPASSYCVRENKLTLCSINLTWLLVTAASIMLTTPKEAQMVPVAKKIGYNTWRY